MVSAARYVARGARVRAVQAATVAATAHMADHLSIMQLRLNLAALI